MQKGKNSRANNACKVANLCIVLALDSTLPCFAALGDQTVVQLRDRFQQGLTQAAVAEHVQRLIDTSLGSTWTRLYDSVRPPYTPVYGHANLTVLTVSILLSIYFVRIYVRMRPSGSEHTNTISHSWHTVRELPRRSAKYVRRSSSQEDRHQAITQ